MSTKKARIEFAQAPVLYPRSLSVVLSGLLFVRVSPPTHSTFANRHLRRKYTTFLALVNDFLYKNEIAEIIGVFTRRTTCEVGFAQ